jgi:hypothetical protein
MTDLYAKWKREIGEEWGAFIASLPTPACDAEKAVLVEALGWCVDRFGHQATCNYSALSGEGCNCDMARVLRVLADRSSAAAALLAQGEALERLVPPAEEAHIVMRGLDRYDTKDLANALTAARAALAPGEETE